MKFCKEILDVSVVCCNENLVKLEEHCIHPSPSHPLTIVGNTFSVGLLARSDQSQD